MSFASDLFSGLAGFRDHLAEIASPLVSAVESDLAKLSPVIATNALQAEQVAKEILHNLYTGIPVQPFTPPTTVSATVLASVAYQFATSAPADTPVAAPVPTVEGAVAPAEVPAAVPVEAAAPVEAAEQTTATA
jgi:hypothetical protein